MDLGDPKTVSDLLLFGTDSAYHAAFNEIFRARSLWTCLITRFPPSFFDLTGHPLSDLGADDRLPAR